MYAQEQKRDELLASILGITADELGQTEWSFDEKTTTEGSVIGLLVKFREGSPGHILDKIKGLDENNTVRLDPNALNDAYEQAYKDDEYEMGGES